MSQFVRTPHTLDLKALSILVVDDQPFFRVLLTEMLRGIGVGHVSVAVDGEDGFAAFEDICPDVVITDWMMPRLDGVDMTRRIRALSDARFQQVPVILVTAKSERTQIELARSAGVDEFLLKPISGKTICDRLREVVERPRPFVNFETYTGPCRRRRADLHCNAPFRRFSDSLSTDSTDAAVLVEGLRSVFCAISAHILDLAFRLPNNDANLSLMVSASRELQAIASDLTDTHLQRVCDLLLEAVQLMATTKSVTPELINTHMDALDILLGIPSLNKTKRDDVIMGLQRTLKSAQAA